MSRLARFLGDLAHSGPSYNPAPLPARGDQVEAWLKRKRDEYADGFTRDPQWEALDAVLDQYRLHADTLTPLHQHVCEGGNCDCPDASNTAPTRRIP